ncbi:precorrin-4 C(11)-methyltransferase [Asaia astilbis]|uniref:precorrin-4 C(11)-methyltransferase n=1 Tax=Asaia astilbis TaxID=610244 RepID=UPI000472F34F|nr:precorrin-4 C(11)-methyltransferase [Asaia astilbis]
MTVHFIGAGPGAADLMTLRGRDLLAKVPLCLYAGSIIPSEILGFCGAQTRLVDTAPLCLDEIEALCVEAHRDGLDVARLHSGDLSLYSAVAEQVARLEKHGIPYTLTPGVPAYAAAASLLGRELTVPGIVQSLVLTRLSGRASAMPEAETLEAFAATGATLAIHLAIHRLEEVVTRLVPFYGASCPSAVVARASWPDERCVEAKLGDIVAVMKDAPETRTALILVGKALNPEMVRESALYDAHYQRRFRGRDETSLKEII